MAIDPYGRTYKRGVQLNWRTVEMLEISELRSLDRLGIVPLQLSQGSYNAGGVAASGGTHDGGGALDVRVSVLPTKYWNTVVYALRKTGFAAWLRNPSQGNWPYHIHAIAIGDKEMSSAAAQQVVWYKQGLNGLWGSAQGPDDGPQVEWTQYRQDIDLSYYGPERWDGPDFDRLIRWLDDPIAAKAAAAVLAAMVDNRNTDPITQIPLKTSLSFAHQHATDGDEQATQANAKASQALTKLDEILGKLPTP